MGQLTNLYVSESYQGLLKLTDSTTGLTPTLQTVQDGLGGNSPLQISQTQVNISGTFTINGSPVAATDTGSLMKTGSVAGNVLTFTKGDGSTFNLQVDTGSVPSGTISGSQQIIDLGFATTSSVNQKLDTGSFNSYTSSIDTRIDGIEAKTGSYATTGSNVFVGDQTITGSLFSSDIIGTGSLFLKPNQSDARLVEIYNTSPLDTHITASGGQIFLGDDVTYVKVDNYGSVERIDIVAGNELVVSSSVTNLTGSLHQSGTFYPDQVDWINSSIQLGTGSYILTTDVSGVTQYDTYQNVASALQPFINTGSFNRDGLITTGSAGGSQSITGSLNVEGTISATSASFTYINTVYETASVIYSSGSNQFGDASNDTQTLWGTVNLPSGPLVITGSVTSTGGFTGSLQGTASYATNALSSSHSIFANTASFLLGTVASASYAVNADTASIANDLIVRGKNNNASTLTRGTIVRIVGANGDNPLFDSASWLNDANSANTLGMLSEDVVTNGFANVVVQGKVIGINTSGMNAGDLLFLSSSGQYTTSSVPAPFHEVRLGQVLRSNINQGSAYITVDNGYELSELHDVDITSPVVGDLLVYTSGSYGQWVNLTGAELGFATTSSVNQKLDTGSFNSYTSSNDSKVNALIAATGSYVTEAESGSFLVTGSVAGNVLTFTKGDGTTFNLSVDTGSNSNRNGLITTGSNGAAQGITGSVDISGSLYNDGNLYNLAPSTTLNVDNYLTSSATSQANIIKGWSDNPASGGPLATQANYTGSLRITGSNNIVSLPQARATGFGLGTDQQGYISGSDNIIAGNNAGIYLNTGSLLFPKISNNYVGQSGFIGMNFTTSSLSGGHPSISSNTIYGGSITINHNSGSIGVSTNLINAGALTSTQNFVTNTRPANSGNILGNAATLNHISSSINFSQNVINSPLTINNHLSSSNITNNSFTFQNNMVVGGSTATGLGVWVSGSQNSNATRQIADNLIGGKNIVISSSFVSSSNSNLYASLIYGQALTVSGSHTTSGTGGSAFLGRYNDSTSLHLAQDIVFAVGTGTSNANRRTGLYIDSGSNVVVSGSFKSIGNVNVTGSVTLSGSAGPELIVIGDSLITGSLGVTGSVFVTGSVQGNVNNLTVASNTASLNLNDGNFFVLQLTGSIDTHINPSNIKAGQTVNIKLNTTGSGTVSFPSSVKQVSGSAYVPSTGTTTDIITLVSFDSTNLFLANVKNLI